MQRQLSSCDWQRTEGRCNTYGGQPRGSLRAMKRALRRQETMLREIWSDEGKGDEGIEGPDGQSMMGEVSLSPSIESYPRYEQQLKMGLMVEEQQPLALLRGDLLAGSSAFSSNEQECYFEAKQNECTRMIDFTEYQSYFC